MAVQSIIRKSGEIWFSKDKIEVLKKIEPGNYLLKFDAQTQQYFLEDSRNFTLPEKIYGNPEKIVDRYLNSFVHKEGNMGVLLSGIKGTGKSLLAKMLCIKSNLPVIIVAEKFMNNELKSFLNNIKQEVIIFIDEYEKIYNTYEEQHIFLSLLDGVFEGKKIYLFTSNEKGRINQYLFNRPGRILYLKEYESLDESTMEDVISDLLENKENKKELKNMLNILGRITMDILVSLIREMNLYNETPAQSLEFLNIRPDDTSYKVDVFLEGSSVGTQAAEEEFMGRGIIDKHPLSDSQLHFYFLNKKTEIVENIQIDLENAQVEMENKTIKIRCNYKNKKATLICKVRDRFLFQFDNYYND
ncbi:MAG: AAA family ATPase [Nanoarchaeota archaeon]